jgi:hypothetical protein
MRSHFPIGVDSRESVPRDETLGLGGFELGLPSVFSAQFGLDSWEILLPEKLEVLQRLEACACTNVLAFVPEAGKIDGGLNVADEVSRPGFPLFTPGIL